MIFTFICRRKLIRQKLAQGGQNVQRQLSHLWANVHYILKKKLDPS